MSIRIGILGYGNLGRGVECAVKHNPDMELVAVFTRRNPDSVKILTPSISMWWTALTPMPEFRSILPLWTLLQRKAEKWR